MSSQIFEALSEFEDKEPIEVVGVYPCEITNFEIESSGKSDTAWVQACTEDDQVIYARYRITTTPRDSSAKVQNNIGMGQLKKLIKTAAQLAGEPLTKGATSEDFEKASEWLIGRQAVITVTAAEKNGNTYFNQKVELVG